MYRRRVTDEILDVVLPHLAAIALEGAKGVGKTATARQRARTEFDLTEASVRQALSAYPQQLRELPPPVLLDEWQLQPDVWDRVRRIVDDDPTGGRFLLTGSAPASPGVRIHSGAGRIVRLHMRPLSIAERAISEPTVSLRRLLSGDLPEIAGSTDVDVAAYTDEILRSGFPGFRDLPQPALGLQLDGYLARIVERELPDAGVTVRRPAALRSWLTAYAAATSTDAGYNVILDAATAGEANKPARQTVDGYREHLQRIFVLDPLSAWIPTFSPLTRLTKTPKHHLVDPALAARLVGVGRDALLAGRGRPAVPGGHAGSWLGALFASLAVQTVRIYAEAAEASVSHLRTRGTDHEIDIIVERSDGSVIAVEVKLAGAAEDRDVRHLNWLQAQLGDRVIDRLIINTGPTAYRRPDGVAVVPLALLGP